MLRVCQQLRSRRSDLNLNYHISRQSTSVSVTLSLFLPSQWSATRPSLWGAIDLTFPQHGVKRVRETPEAAAAKKLREQSKIKDYLALEADVLSKVDPDTARVLLA